jgi:hypothetical protein
MISKFNKWYDALPEPWRFLLAMTLIMTGITGLSFGGPFVKVVSAIYLFVLTIVRMFGAYNAAT